MQPNLSGKAVELIQNRLDMQVFIYMSNFAKTMKRCGEVWLSMMKDIVVEDNRRMKTVDRRRRASGSVVMNEPRLRRRTGEDYAQRPDEGDLRGRRRRGPEQQQQARATVRGC
jgi:hypothetical protein